MSGPYRALPILPEKRQACVDCGRHRSKHGAHNGMYHTHWCVMGTRFDPITGLVIENLVPCAERRHPHPLTCPDFVAQPVPVRPLPWWAFWRRGDA